MIPIANPELGAREEERVSSVLRSGMLAAGDEVDEFESAFATFCGAEHAVATSNGTTALHAGCVAAGIGPGDTVVTSPFSFIASANAIRFAGATPVFADIRPDTYTLDPESVEQVIGNRDDVDAILAVHLYGLAADIPSLRDVAERHDVTLIEDAAQAHGATVDGEPVGSAGDVACFSFYPTKNMTTGEGGMITTDDPDIAQRARRFVNHGQSDSYTHETLGHNFRMTDLAAAIGRVQLEKLPKFVERRRQNAAELTAGLADCPVAVPTAPDGRRHAFHQYTIRTEHRDELRTHLEENGVGTGVYYPTPIHEQPAYDDWSVDLPVAERAAEEVLSLPVHPALSTDDIETIIGTVDGFGFN